MIAIYMDWDTQILMIMMWVDVIVLGSGNQLMTSVHLRCCKIGKNAGSKYVPL
jgi:hypothetical protein